VDDKDQIALGETASGFPPQPAGAGNSARAGIAAALERADAMTTQDGRIGTLSEPDKVSDAVVPSWTEFADLSIEKKFEQARPRDFDVRE
jgi:hypothetical protein